MTNKQEILNQIQNKVSDLIGAGDVILSVGNHTSKELVYEYFTDELGHYHLKLYKKSDTSIPSPAPHTCLAKDKMSFVMDLNKDLIPLKGDDKDE
jgi:hypothetical protein